MKSQCCILSHLLYYFVTENVSPNFAFCGLPSLNGILKIANKKIFLTSGIDAGNRQWIPCRQEL